MPSVDTVPPEETRRARREGRGIFPAPVFLPEARTLEIDGPAGSLALRVIAPPEGGPGGAFLHIHGGGWTLGENDMQDPRLLRLARETGLAVVSVGYRLAPEHPYPAGPDDCEAAALWLLSSEGRELAGDGPLAIGGDSAGAHLTVVTLLRLRDRHLVTGAFAAAVLQYGVFDLSMTPSQRLWGERHLVLSGSIMRWFADQFVPTHDREQRRDPDVSPLFADLDAMPPAIFTIGTEDALLDDTLFMEARWRMAGAPTELRVWPEAPHGFVSLPMSVADAALSAEHEFLRRTLGLT
jgi:acetyl esterase/lipase